MASILRCSMIEALEQSIQVLQAQVDEGVANELDLNRTMAQLREAQPF